MNDPKESTPVNDEAIEAMAASWLVQRDEGFTAEQAEEFARWLAASPRHVAAVALLEETCGILAKMPLARSALAPDFAKANDPVVFESAARSYDQSANNVLQRSAKVVRLPVFVKIAMAVAACIALAIILWRIPSGRETFNATYATADGDHLRVRLPDESVLELNVQTEVRVQFSKADRRVTLTQGEAHFTVAKNPTRPFFVNAGNVAVRAVGTAFNVRWDKSSVDVLVTEGRVQVTKDQQAAFSSAAVAPDASLLVAGQRVSVPTEITSTKAATVTQLDAGAIREVLAWQSPRLVFADTPLSEVVQQFNRYNRVQLSIGDAELGPRPVGGTFRADRVETFVDLFEKSGDIAVERPNPDRIVLRKVAPAR